MLVPGHKKNRSGMRFIGTYPEPVFWFSDRFSDRFSGVIPDRRSFRFLSWISGRRGSAGISGRPFASRGSVRFFGWSFRPDRNAVLQRLLSEESPDRQDPVISCVVPDTDSLSGICGVDNLIITKIDRDVAVVADHVPGDCL